MKKSNVAIVIDSTATIPIRLIKKYKFFVMPLRINWPGKNIESQEDSKNLAAEDFYRKLKKSSEIPTTSQPSPGEFGEFFKEIGKTHSDIVAILVSDQLSGTIKSASFSLNTVEDTNIEIVDSKTVGLSLGLIAIMCAEMAEKGHSIDEIAARAREGAENSRTWVVVDTLDYLHKGGRVSGSKKFIGNILSMKPILNMVDGKIELFGSVRTKKKAIKTILDIIEVKIKNNKNVQIGVTHANVPALAHETATLIRKRFSPENLYISNISHVVGTHTGPGALGISYLVMD